MNFFPNKTLPISIQQPLKILRQCHRLSATRPPSDPVTGRRRRTSPCRRRRRRRPPHFQSAISERKLRRPNSLAALLRFAAFCFSLASAVFMASNASRSEGAPSWHDFDLFRFVVVANGIVAVYSLVEMGATISEMLKGTTMLPELLQLWFDFSHDQVFAYMVLSAEASDAGEARNLRRGDTCTVENSFCIQAYISVALGFVGFVFLSSSSLISGYQVVSYLITGSHFHL